MKFKVAAAILLLACFLTGVSVAGQKVSPPPPETKPAISTAADDTTQKQKMLDEYEKSLEKREVTLDRAMGVLNTSIASFDSATNIWTIFLTVIGIIIGVATATLTGFGIYWWDRFRTLKSVFEEDMKKVKGTIAELEPIAKKIREIEREVEAARENTVGSVQEMTVGKEEKPSPEMKDKIDELARKIDFLESFGVELKPEDYLNKGISFFSNQDYEKALLAFEHAIKLNPKNDAAWTSKGAVFNNLKRYKEALAACEQAITLNLNNYVAWNNKGATLNGLKRHDEALVALEQALVLNPKNDAAWSNRGESLAGLKRIDEAKEAYKKASIVTDHLDRKAYCEACLYCLEGKREESLAAIGKAIALDEINKERALENVGVFGPLFNDPEFKKLTS